MGSSAEVVNKAFAQPAGENSDTFSLENVFRAVYDYSSWSGSVNLPALLATLIPHTRNMKSSDKEYHRLYMKLYRRVKKLEELGLVTVEKRDDGLLWVVVTWESLNLIQQARNSNFREKPFESIFNLPKKVRPERIEAIKKVLHVKMLNKHVANEIKELFEDYLWETSNKVIVLKRSPDAPADIPPFFIVPSVNRFNSKSIRVNNLKKYETIWEKASESFEHAVFVTLTTDPKRFKSLWHSWRHFAKSFNRFMSYLRKIFGFRPPYIAVYEFTKETGLMHVHVVFFGIRYLMHYRKLSYIWSKEGQGQIVHVYTIRNDGNGWHWTRMRPKDVRKGESAENYLKKYLKKALFNVEGLFLYWVSNKRFFTYSRVFSQYLHKKPLSLGWYEFFGVFAFDEVPAFVLLPETYVSYRVLYEYPELDPGG